LFINLPPFINLLPLKFLPLQYKKVTQIKVNIFNVVRHHADQLYIHTLAASTISLK